MKNTLFLASLSAIVLALSPAAGADGCNNYNNLTCDAGGPYHVNASPGIVSLQLDGTDSHNETGYSWSTNYPGALFVDSHASRPTLTIPVTNDCGFTVSVQLTVTNGNQSRSCCTYVNVRDGIKPVIECPSDSKVFCGMDESPESNGFATATDNCDQNVHVSYYDRIVPAACAAERFDHVIERTWKARDNDCNVKKCVQLIDVVKVVTALDVLPGVCPNTYNRNSCDLLPVAILGMEGFDVTRIQWNSVRMWGKLCEGGPVAAQSFHLADVGTPFFGGAECDCHDVNGDGRLDLVVKFKRNKINCAFNISGNDSGTAIPVILTGKLTCSGCKFIAQDCIVVQ